VPVGHELDLAGRPVSLDVLAASPLVLCGTSMESGSGAAVTEVLGQLVARGRAVRPRATVDTPQTLLELVRAGVGIGVLNAVALGPLDLTGLVVLDIDDPSLEREVATYWYDAITLGGTGMELHRALIAAPRPSGAKPSEG
jgi:DNA-binding transcriptional LysR family regulator